MAEICRQGCRPVEGHDQKAVEGEEVWGESDPGIHPVGEDVAPVQADMKMIGDITSEDFHPDSMSYLVSEDIGPHQDLSGNDKEQDTKKDHPGGKASE